MTILIPIRVWTELHFIHGHFVYYQLGNAMGNFLRGLFVHKTGLGMLVTHHAPGHHGWWLRVLRGSVFVIGQS